MESGKRQKLFSSLFVNGTLILLVFLWTIPTLGIFVSSFRNRDDIAKSGWWSVLPHREWQAVKEIIPGEAGLDPDGVMEVEGVTGTFDELREGIATPDGKRVTWIGNKRIGKIEVQEQVWTVTWNFTLDNYNQVLGGQDFEFTKPDGTVVVVPGDI
jgi:alpha-glucoside transport system permease protein